MAQKNNGGDLVKSILPPFLQRFLEVQVKLLNGEDKKINELIHWDVRGYQQEAKDPSVNEKYDLWLDKKSGQWCIKHRALEKLADVMGIEIDESTIHSHSQPTVDNRYQHIFTLTVRDPQGKKATYVGEANNAGGGMVQNNYNAYPASMAFKRAFDRAILKLIIKIARQEYLTKKEYAVILNDQDIHVDIESDEWVNENNGQKEDQPQELTSTEEGQLVEYFKAINMIDLGAPKKKTEKDITEFEVKVAEAETKLDGMSEYINKQDAISERQKQALFGMIDEKKKQIAKIKKDYGFGKKQPKKGKPKS